MKKIIFNLLFLVLAGMVIVGCEKQESILVESETNLFAPEMKLNSSKKVYVITQKDLMITFEKLFNAKNSKSQRAQLRELPNKKYELTVYTLDENPDDPPPTIVCAGNGSSFFNCVSVWLNNNANACLVLYYDFASNTNFADDEGC